MSLIARVTALAQAIAADVKVLYAGKVDKVTGKGLSTEDYTTTEKSKLGAIAPGATANSTDAALLARANHTGTQPISTVASLQTTLDAKLATALRGALNGVASLDAAGKIPVSQLPPLAVNEVFTVASQAAMLALTAERGDIAIRSDLGGASFVLAADAPGTPANWITLAQALSIALNALNSLTPAADRLPYFDSASTAQLAVFTAQARTFMAAADQAAQRTAIGLPLVDNTSDATKLAAALTQLRLYGVGGVGTATLADLDASNIPSGLYRALVGATGIPAAVSSASLNVLVISFNANYSFQLAATVTATAGVKNRMLWRTINNGIPDVWREAVDQAALDLKAPLASPDFTGNVTIGGSLTLTPASSKLVVQGSGMEFGRVDGVASPAYIDFHSGSTLVDHDARIISTGGNGSSAGAALQLQAGSIGFNGLVTMNNTLTASGDITINKASGNPSLTLDGVAGTQRALYLRTAGSERWRIGASTAAESGSNAGTDLFVSRYSDAGSGLSTPLAISRTTGRTTLALVTVNGEAVVAGPLQCGQYTLTTLPSAATYNGYTIDVTNATGGPKQCRSNGTNWLITNTSTIVS